MAVMKKMYYLERYIVVPSDLDNYDKAILLDVRTIEFELEA
jgi:hypothetical protein